MFLKFKVFKTGNVEDLAIMEVANNGADERIRCQDEILAMPDVYSVQLIKEKTNEYATEMRA